MARAASKSAQGKHAKAGSKARETAPGKPQLKSAEGKGGERKNLEPQQARSRESLRKLLKAAAEVLGQHGIEGTTIPRIAAHAGLTPGAIYRRFDDKDALLETMILGILERQGRAIAYRAYAGDGSANPLACLSGTGDSRTRCQLPCQCTADAFYAAVCANPCRYGVLEEGLPIGSSLV